MFELTAGQLPMLEAAERRHGSKRKALIAALEAGAEIDQLRTTAASAERSAEKETAGKRRAAEQRDKAVEKLERELKAAQTRLAARERDLAEVKDGADDVGAALAEERRLYDQRATEHEQELVELEERAIDHLFCARCGKWAAPGEWAWTREDDGAEYAHHQPCGDRPPGLVGVSSWLAHRAPE